MVRILSYESAHMCLSYVSVSVRAHLPHRKLTLREEIYNKMTQTYVSLIWPSLSPEDPDNCQLTDDITKMQNSETIKITTNNTLKES